MLHSTWMENVTEENSIRRWRRRNSTHSLCRKPVQHWQKVKCGTSPANAVSVTKESLRHMCLRKHAQEWSPSIATHIKAVPEDLTQETSTYFAEWKVAVWISVYGFFDSYIMPTLGCLAEFSNHLQMSGSQGHWSLWVLWVGGSQRLPLLPQPCL